MLRAEISELQYISHRDNLVSIANHGILSFEAVRQMPHASVAMNEIQENRDRIQVPGGLRLHQYANLYFHARNPMMYKRKDLHADLAVLQVDTAVLDLPNVVITDQNAASKYRAWWPSPAGLSKVNRDLTFAEDWRDPDTIAYWQKRSAKCAEVLVPHKVDPRYIRGVYASSGAGAAAIRALGLAWPVTVNAHLFFQG